MSCPCIFASDLHGSISRFQSLWDAVESERPTAVFLGGDLLPGFSGMGTSLNFVQEALESKVVGLRDSLGPNFPQVFLIPGNDDTATEFSAFESGEQRGLWRIIHLQRDLVSSHPVFGYGCVPPTPFMLKDWERFDVSRFVDPGSLSPEEGHRTIPADADDIRYGTIKRDLELMAGTQDLSDSLWLFHSPPYQSNLDRAALDGQSIDHVPLDVNVGSIAIRRFIENRQPLVTLHGHVHESARLTGHRRQQLGRTWMFSAAHDGPELALVRVDLDGPEAATRQLV